MRCMSAVDVDVDVDAVVTTSHDSQSNRATASLLPEMHRRQQLMVIGVAWTLFAVQIVRIAALPVTLLEDAKATESRSDNKVKRSQAVPLSLNEETNSGSPVDFYNNPSAAKRASSLKPDIEDGITEWNQQPYIYDGDKQDELPRELFAGEENPLEGRTLAEYAKGFRYGANKAKLDEQLENAILKSEIYGDASIPFRYYGDTKRRKRRNIKRSNVGISNRYKRELELTPEDILTLLSLWDEERLRQQENYRPTWSRYPNFDLDTDKDENSIDEPEENWLEAPVYPGARNHIYHQNPYGFLEPNEYENQGIFSSKRPWGDFGDKKKKRFMVSRRKRYDPTRELRFLNGPVANHDELYF